jgi:phage terminase large subunit-like protein
MNYVEIIARQQELQKELQDLQEARIACAQAHEDVVTEIHDGDLTVGLTIEYDNDDTRIISVEKDGEAVHLSVEDFNKVNTFLGMYNDAIFSYMSEKAKGGEDVESAE